MFLFSQVPPKTTAIEVKELMVVVNLHIIRVSTKKIFSSSTSIQGKLMKSVMMLRAQVSIEQVPFLVQLELRSCPWYKVP